MLKEKTGISIPQAEDVIQNYRKNNNIQIVLIRRIYIGHIFLQLLLLPLELGGRWPCYFYGNIWAAEAYGQGANMIQSQLKELNKRLLVKLLK